MSSELLYSTKEWLKGDEAPLHCESYGCPKFDNQVLVYIHWKEGQPEHIDACLRHISVYEWLCEIFGEAQQGRNSPLECKEHGCPVESFGKMEYIRWPYEKPLHNVACLRKKSIYQYLCENAGMIKGNGGKFLVLIVSEDEKKPIYYPLTKDWVIKPPSPLTK